jgi:hypothetical protein
MAKQDSNDDWKSIKQIKAAFNGAEDSSLGPILKSMIESSVITLNQLESAYLKLNFFANGLKTGLQFLTQSDASDGIGDDDTLASFK